MSKMKDCKKMIFFDKLFNVLEHDLHLYCLKM